MMVVAQMEGVRIFTPDELAGGHSVDDKKKVLHQLLLIVCVYVCVCVGVGVLSVNYDDTISPRSVAIMS